MSRISKRKEFLQSSSKQRGRELFCRPAIYTRLSSMFREKGELYRRAPPYGYGAKWINHQKTLVPDETAAVVRMIYDSF